MAGVTIKNVGIIKKQLFIAGMSAACWRLAVDLLQTNLLRRQQVYSKSV
jgi:hypothetical protein